MVQQHLDLRLVHDEQLLQVEHVVHVLLVEMVVLEYLLVLVEVVLLEYQ